jgi:hypothetical protein
MPQPISTSTTILTVALKEWAVTVDALAQADTILLLRKGGIREQGGSFQVAHSRIWLYPTYEHQKPHLLKPEYADRVTPVESGWHPETVPIQAWADITHTFQVSEAETVEALLPFHIWNQQFAIERLKWKPKTPIALLLLRVHRLPQAQTIPYREEYGGCKSWIELALSPDVSHEPAKPVLPDEVYQKQVEAIEQKLKSERL